MKKPVFKKTTICLGSVTVNIPVITFGQGKNTIGLVIGVHGVETSGFLLLKKLFEKRKKLKNKIEVIPSANPSGLLLASRFGELDLPVNKKDPNRNFPGQSNGSVQQRINFAVLNLILSCDFVIDIHNYSNLGKAFPLLGIGGFKNSKAIVKSVQKSLNFLKVIEPKFVFFIDEKQAEKRAFSGTFDDALNAKGIPNVSFELPPIEFWSEKDLENLSEKIIKAINSVGCKRKIKKKMPKMINTQLTRSEIAGMFFPALKPPINVKKGQLLGEIFDPFALKSIKIKSPRDGLLVVIKRKDFVRVGEFLFEIGYDVNLRFL